MNSSGTHLWLVLWKAYESLHAHAIRHIQSLGLGFSDFAVLEVLLHKGPTPVNTIGELVHLTSGSITVAVDRMEAKGLVQRCNHPSDRRARVVHLTPTGETLIRCAFTAHETAMELATAGLTPAEQVQAVALLKKLGLHARAELDRKPLAGVHQNPE
ncbi:MAG: transcriptional regulator, MarR family [Candidatus Solibacter sp.]|jgi:MarR family 2-MHQ and catechol resistance regulon transcriptional repressor|nr:transcriptional regulator, MarR family [Candidatus Solibacter sp.]